MPFGISVGGGGGGGGGGSPNIGIGIGGGGKPKVPEWVKDQYMHSTTGNTTPSGPLTGNPIVDSTKVGLIGGFHGAATRTIDAAKRAMGLGQKPGDGSFDRLPMPSQSVNLGDSAAYNAMKERALSTGPSAWLGLQTQKINSEASGLRDQAVGASSLAQSQGLSNLAQTGGLDSGARERLAASGQAGLLNSLQGVNKQAQIARLNAGMEDERTKNEMLSQLMPTEFGVMGGNLDRTSRSTAAENMARAIAANGDPSLVQQLFPWFHM